MSVLTDYGLKEDDVEFLLTIHHIEKKSTEYDNTDPGETVANVTVVKQASDLSKNQIDYRAREGDDNRGLAEDGMNLIRSYPPRVEGKGFGPRSMELTEKGERVVAEIKELRSSGGGRQGGDAAASSEEIEELRAEVSELREAVENNSADVDGFKESRTGALGGDMASKLKAISRAVPQQQFIFSEVFGIDMETVQETDVGDEDGIRQLRVAAYNHLTKSLEADDGVDLEAVLDGDGEAESPAE